MTDQSRNKLRGKLLDELSSILLGPREEEERLTSNPSDMYLTGVLWPKETDFSAAEDEGMENSAEGGDDDATDTSTRFPPAVTSTFFPASRLCPST